MRLIYKVQHKVSGNHRLPNRVSNEYQHHRNAMNLFTTATTVMNLIGLFGGIIGMQVQKGTCDLLTLRAPDKYTGVLSAVGKGRTDSDVAAVAATPSLTHSCPHTWTYKCM